MLLSWIERGEVSRRSANQFYSMVQSANSHVRRLMNEKATHEQEMEEAKENFKNALTGILTQCKYDRGGRLPCRASPFLLWPFCFILFYYFILFVWG